MQQTIQLKLLPSEAADDSVLREYIGRVTARRKEEINGYQLIKRSIDARGRQPHILLTVKVFINEPYREESFESINFPDVSRADRQVLIVGAGPAGLFAALRLIEKGIRPVLLERGKDVRARRRDLAALNKEGVINPESNYCFGEGGAGTYSDGKLYTRSTKRGDVNQVLKAFVAHGASEDILIDARPHIGTNKLPGIITAIRETIQNAGGEVHFDTKVTSLVVEFGKIKGVKTADDETWKADAVILATGHSARDIFEMLHRQNILIEAKPFALGVRIEHPQEIIDRDRKSTRLNSSH